jgi:hypothetical protein
MGKYVLYCMPTQAILGLTHIAPAPGSGTQWIGSGVCKTTYEAIDGVRSEWLPAQLCGITPLPLSEAIDPITM